VFGREGPRDREPDLARGAGDEEPAHDITNR
jgi:hypothetical protein